MKLLRLATTCFALLAAAATASATDVPLVGDAHVNSTRTTTNYGTSSNLYVGGGNNTFLQFDTTQLPTGTTSSQISKATLLVFVNRVNTSAAVSVNAVTSTWAEGSVTYATMPTVSTTATGTFTPTTAGVYVAVDVTALVQSWIAGTATNYGIALTSASGNVLFDSKENDQTAHPARLDVTLSTTLPTILGGGISYGTGSTGSVSVNNSNPLAPIITATLPTVVQSIAVTSTTGNTTPSVTVDNTTTPTTPKITVNFPAAGGATSTLPNIEVFSAVTSNQTTNVGSFATYGQALIFSSTSLGGVTLSGGNTWDGTYFTVGATGAGLYRFDIQVREPSTAAYIGCIAALDKNNSLGTGAGVPAAVGPFESYSSQAYPTGGRDGCVLNSVQLLSAGDKIDVNLASNSTVIGISPSTDGNSNITITRLK